MGFLPSALVGGVADPQGADKHVQNSVYVVFKVNTLKSINTCEGHVMRNAVAILTAFLIFTIEQGAVVLSDKG